MTEFNPEQHELKVNQIWLMMSKVAIFDDLIDYYLDGVCTLEEAVEQYEHDIKYL